MKINFIYIKFSKLIFIITVIILIIITLFILIKHTKSTYFNLSPEAPVSNLTNTTSYYESPLPSNLLNTEEKIPTITPVRTLPNKIDGFEIIGMITIPKLNLENYILAENNSKALDVSIIKLCGPYINEIGNFCLAGHNYKKMFKEIKYLNRGDQIMLTNIYGRTTSYQVYANYETSPKDISCLNQDTDGEKEITLITCTTGAINRIIIKAIEIYD